MGGEFPVALRIMSTLILGAHGQLGSELQRLLPTATGLSRAQLDFTHPQAFESLLEPYQPHVLINCAAYTHVDRAETERDLAFQLNAEAPAALARYCRNTGCRLIHVSTDFVFGGELLPDRPRRETDPAIPLSVYGASKLSGEQRILEILPEALILRTCGLYGHGGTGNFVRTMLRLARSGQPLRVVNDQTCAPTATTDFAQALIGLMNRNTGGLFHVVNRGAITWHDFARRIFELSGVSADLRPITSAEYAAPAPRPRYSVLDIGQYERLTGETLPEIEAALSRFLASPSA